MYISRIFPSRPLPKSFDPRDFPHSPGPYPDLCSFPGVITRTSGIWENVLDIGYRAEIEKGVVIYPESTLPPFIYVKSGKVCVNFINEMGNEHVLHYNLTGATVWDAFYCTQGQIPTMPLKVLEDSELYLFDSRISMVNLMQINPLLVNNLLYTQATKNLMYSKLYLINTYKTALTRIALLIHEMYSAQNKMAFPAHITQYEMGKLLHMHKVTVSNCIAKMKDAGALSLFTKNRVEINDPERLRALAHNDSSMD